MWQQWVSVILGLWIIAVPFLGFSGAALMWTLTITGVVVAGLALWGSMYEQSEEHMRELQHRTG